MDPRQRRLWPTLAPVVAHLVVDQLASTMTHPVTYFITFRASRGFPTNLFDRVDEKAIDWMNVPLHQLWKHF